MSHPFPTLGELAMRVVLLKELPWEEDLEGLPMKKELEALGRLPGNYTVTKSSTEVTKAGGGVLSPGEMGFAESSLLYGLKEGEKIAFSKEMCGLHNVTPQFTSSGLRPKFSDPVFRGDPPILWNIATSTESRKSAAPIFAKPQRHKFGLGSRGYVDTKMTNFIGGGKVEQETCSTGKVEKKEECFTGKVEMEVCTWYKGKVMGRQSSSWELDSKGKLEGTWKEWGKLRSGAEVELIITWVAQRD